MRDFFRDLRSNQAPLLSKRSEAKYTVSAERFVYEMYPRSFDFSVREM